MSKTKLSIDELWVRLRRFEGEGFETKARRIAYEITGAVLRASRTDYNILKSEFSKALALVPFEGKRANAVTEDFGHNSMAREFEQDLERLVGAVGVLSSDVEQAAALSQTTDTQFARRAYVRAAFALVEGNLNLMADVILRAGGRGVVHLESRALEVLRQERRVVDEGGIAAISIKFVPVRDRITPVFELFARLYGKSFRLDKGGTGWADFARAIEVRNRITHPKDAASFEIADQELDVVENARGWFADSVETLLDVCA